MTTRMRSPVIPKARIRTMIKYRDGGNDLIGQGAAPISEEQRWDDPRPDVELLDAYRRDDDNGQAFLAILYRYRRFVRERLEREGLQPEEAERSVGAVFIRALNSDRESPLSELLLAEAIQVARLGRAAPAKVLRAMFFSVAVGAAFSVWASTRAGLPFWVGVLSGIPASIVAALVLWRHSNRLSRKKGVAGTAAKPSGRKNGLPSQRPGTERDGQA